MPVLGRDEETLKQHRLSHERIIKAAERTQKRTNSYEPEGLGGARAMFDLLKDNPKASLLDELIYVNVPICDLDSLDDKIEFGKGKSALWHVSINCAKVTLGDSEWPYKYDG